MKHQKLISITLFILMSLISCSNDSEYNFKNVQSTEDIKTKTLKVNDSNDSIPEINSLEEFYLLIKQLKEENGYKIDKSLLFSDEVYPISKAISGQRTVEGYTNYQEYAGMKDLEIKFSDFQTADKLGLVANKTYFISICQVHNFLALESNMHAGVANSPYCGLILDHPRTDNFITAPRGYVANVGNSKFYMYTDLVYFLDYSDNPKIWYPSRPESLKWNINVLIM